MENLSLTTSAGSYVLDATAQTLIFTSTDGTTSVTLSVAVGETAATEVHVTEGEEIKIVEDDESSAT